MLPQLLYLSFQLRRANEIFLRCLTRHVCLDQTHVYLKRLADAKMSRLKSIFLIFDIFDQLFVLRFWSNICFELFDRMLVSRCWSNVFLRRLVKCVCFKVFEKMFILGFLVKCLFNCFVPSFFSIFILFLFTYPPRCHSRWDRPHGPSSNSDPSSLLVGHTVQVTTQYTLHSWPHSTGDFTFLFVLDFS